MPPAGEPVVRSLSGQWIPCGGQTPCNVRTFAARAEFLALAEIGGEG